jgi:molecular chaperone GrpE
MTDATIPEVVEIPEETSQETPEPSHKQLLADYTALKKEHEELQGIAKRAQYDYINLKLDFDRYQKQMEAFKSQSSVTILIDVVRKFLPFVENLRKSLATLTDAQKEEPLAAGLGIVYSKFLDTLAGLSIKPIESIGLVPDSDLHEPVSALPVENKSQKGKIVQEFERGFVYQKGDERIVISTSKVVVGQ